MSTVSLNYGGTIGDMVSDRGLMICNPGGARRLGLPASKRLTRLWRPQGARGRRGRSCVGSCVSPKLRDAARWRACRLGSATRSEPPARSPPKLRNSPQVPMVRELPATRESVHRPRSCESLVQIMSVRSCCKHTIAARPNRSRRSSRRVGFGRHTAWTRRSSLSSSVGSGT